MKSRITTRSTKLEKSYPYLGMAKDDLLILFTSRNTGTVLHPGNCTHSIGTHSSSWMETQFDPFHGSIQIDSE